MDRRTRAFLVIVVALAAGLLILLPKEPLTTLDLRALAGLLGFFLVATLAEGLAIDFGTGKQARSSLAFLPLLACTILFSPIVSVVIVVTTLAVSSFLLRRQSLLKGGFNIAQVVISVGLAGTAYGLRATPLASGPDVEISYLGFSLLAASFFSTNILFASSAIAVIRRQPLSLILPQVVGPRGANLWYDLLASPIAIVTAILYDDYWITGLFVIILPLLLIRYSYLSKLQLEEANRDLLKVLVKAIETRDPYTSGHSLRVATLARLIGRDLDLPNSKVEQVEMAALLHDIGKIDSIYSAVIRKPYDLNTDEKNLIRTHATKGADLLETLSSVGSEIVRAVRHHHERFDGTGYPDGLRGEGIPIAARIIMLSDSIDAMLSDRPYRKALTVEHVYGELARCSSSQFDPSIVRVILGRDTLQRAAELVRREQELGPDIPALVRTG